MPVWFFTENPGNEHGYKVRKNLKCRTCTDGRIPRVVVLTNGSMPLEVSNAGVYGLSVDGSIVGMWLNFLSEQPEMGDRLECLTARFTIPAETTNGIAVASDQSISVDSVRWSVSMPGDLSGQPVPLELETN